MYQGALQSDTVNSPVQQLLSPFPARALRGWGGRGGSQSVSGGWLFPSRKGVSVVFTAPPLDLCRELHLSLNVQRQPQPLGTAPLLCPALCSCSYKPCAPSIPPFCPSQRCTSVWGLEKLNSQLTPNSPVSPCSFHFQRKFTPSSGGVADRPWTPRRVTKVLSTEAPALLIHHYHLVCSPTTKWSSPTTAQLSTLMASYPPP